VRRIRRCGGIVLAPLPLRWVQFSLDPLPRRRRAAPVKVPEDLAALFGVQRRELDEELFPVHPVLRHGTRS
jgi:hypothetical protein